MLCGFLPYSAQFANGYARGLFFKWGRGPREHPTAIRRAPVRFCFSPRIAFSFPHRSRLWRGRPLHTPALATARRHDAMARSVQEPITHENAQAHARRAVIFVCLICTAFQHDCDGDCVLLSSRRSCQGLLTSGDWCAARPLSVPLSPLLVDGHALRTRCLHVHRRPSMNL